MEEAGGPVAAAPAPVGVGISMPAYPMDSSAGGSPPVVLATPSVQLGSVDAVPSSSGTASPPLSAAPLSQAAQGLATSTSVFPGTAGTGAPPTATVAGSRLSSEAPLPVSGAPKAPAMTTCGAQAPPLPPPAGSPEVCSVLRQPDPGLNSQASQHLMPRPLEDAGASRTVASPSSQAPLERVRSPASQAPLATPGAAPQLAESPASQAPLAAPAPMPQSTVSPAIQAPQAAPAPLPQSAAYPCSQAPLALSAAAAQAAASPTVGQALHAGPVLTPQPARNPQAPSAAAACAPQSAVRPTGHVASVAPAAAAKEFAPQPTVPGGEVGHWTYICVDPNGCHTDKSNLLIHGQMVQVCERWSKDGVQKLRLADNSGWVQEIEGKTRHMSKVTFMDCHGETLVLDPAFDKALSVSASPGGPQERGRTLKRFTVVSLRQRAWLIPSAEKKNDKHLCFLKVDDGNGMQGWVQEVPGPGKQESAFRDCTVEGNLGGGFYGSGWLSVLPGCKAKVLTEDQERTVTVREGDLLDALERVTIGKVVYYRLVEGLMILHVTAKAMGIRGGWVCRTDSWGKPVVELLQREPHLWLYVCCDSSGANIRDTPTRANRHDKDKMVKHRQEVKVTEKVTFPGVMDSFLKLASGGWVPCTKSKSDTVKMKPVQSLECAAPPPPPAAVAPPFGFAPPAMQPGPPLGAVAGPARPPGPSPHWPAYGGPPQPPAAGREFVELSRARFGGGGWPADGGGCGVAAGGAPPGARGNGGDFGIG